MVCIRWRGYIPLMAQVVRRQFITVSGRWGRRQVHYHYAGSGPPVLLLHQSPQSSREMVSLMQEWASDFTVIAPDSPGYGLSDTLGVAEASLEDFAAATLEFADALGLRDFGVYGFHTGGMIGIAMAANHPTRVKALACNGVLVPDAAELQSMLESYLPLFELHWDGSHLAWLWARLREQTIFFPWHNRTLAGRMDFPMPAAQQLQGGVLEFLRAGNEYRVAYRAAFVFDAAAAVARLRMPALVTAAARDPLESHLSRLPGADELPVYVQVAGQQSPADVIREAHQLLQVNSAVSVALNFAGSDDSPDLHRRLVHSNAGSVHIWCGGASDKPTLLVLHDAGSSAALLGGLLQGLSQYYRVVAPDLPGHGESDSPDGGPALRTCTAAVSAVIAELQQGPPHCLGIGSGAVVTLQLIEDDIPLGHVLLKDLPVVDSSERAAWMEQGCPSMAAEWSGGHLLRAWHQIRDSRLYFPWFDRSQAGIRWQEPALDNMLIQAEVTELLKAEGSWQALERAALEVSLEQTMQPHATRITVCGAPGSPWFHRNADIAGRLGIRFAVLPDAPEAQAQVVAAELSAGTV